MPKTSRLAALIGWLGVAVFIGTCLVTAVAYVGKEGESYSPLSHYVSELGEIKNSELNLVFNSGIAIGGICLAVLLFEVGRRIAGRRGWAIRALGVLAGVSGTFVGVVTMDQKTPHLIVSGTFFLALAASVGLATLWMGGPRFPKRPALQWLGLLTVVAAVVFFILIRLEGPGPGGAADVNAPHPAIALDYVLEWLAFVGVLGWVTVAGISIWRTAGQATARFETLSGASR